jgi:hypothetical protein
MKHEYCVMVSERGLPSVIYKGSREYPYMVQSGNYREVFTGTRAECQHQEQGIIESFTDVLIYSNQD